MTGRGLRIVFAKKRDVSYYSRGNKCQFWQIFVEAVEESPNYFIQSKTSASSHEYLACVAGGISGHE